jgi:YVTN family beta-propeller protein
MRRRPAAPDRVLATVLFTDIVGSTELAAEMGDRSWKALLARHHAIVRKELKRFGGKEIDTAGDGFFAIFERPARAVECTSAIMEGLRPLGIRIRAGIHMGECEVMGSKVGGITVHVGARVLGRAEPDQILVTGTVRDVAAGSGIDFDDRGVQELKGVPGQWRLFAVERKADEQLSQTDRRVLEALEAPVPTARRAWARLVAAGGVGAALAAGVLALVLARGGETPPVVARSNTAVRVDPSTNSFVTVVDVGDTPTGVAIADGSVWVLSPTNRTITAIDLDTGETIPIGLTGPATGIAAGSGSVWVTLGFGEAGTRSGAVLRVSTTTKQPEQPIAVPHGTRGIAIGEGAAWVTNGVENTVTRIDVESGEVFDPVPEGEQPEGIAVGEGSIWVANTLSKTVARLDPGTLESQGGISLGDQPSAIAVGFEKVWVTSMTGNSLMVIDVETERLATSLPIGHGPTGVAVGGDAVWVSLSQGSLARVDPASNRIDRTLQLPGPAGGVAASGDVVWVTVQG